VNNDPGADKIRESLQWHDPEGSYVLDDMTPTDYLRAVYNCAAVIGNSSSGIIEAPALGVPTVNIGCRQEGRQHGPSVFDAKPTAKNIEFGINWALGYNYKFTNPYGTAGASAKIADILMNTEIEMVKRI
jgi:UDP-N-acetylglucosamine 2-epimerase